MVWRSVRNYFLAEFLAWAAFLAFGLLLAALGARSSAQWVSNALVLLWFALFVGIYLVLHNRRKQRG